MDLSDLQLGLNIALITGLLSLAGYCYLLRQENRKLAAGRKVDSSILANAVPNPVAKLEATNTEVVNTVVTLPCPVPSLEAPKSPEDIRTFAAGSRTRWVKSIASSKSHNGCY
jgi:hypothetical protein